MLKTSILTIAVALFLVCGLSESLHAQGTLMPSPPHSSTYNGNPRGYWFVAPVDFTIVGLRVPDDFSTAPQSVNLVEMPTAASGSVYTNLHHTGSLATTTVIPVNIPITQGAVLAVLGYRGTVNSYATGNYPSTIGGQPVTLTRVYNNASQITSAPATGQMTFSSGSLARVEIYYQIGPTLGVIGAPASALAEFANATNGGDGVEAASFEIEANDDAGIPGIALTEIALRATGTGDDSTAYSEVAIYRDDNAGAVPNAFDIGSDVLIDSTTAFPADDGLIVFTLPTAEQAFIQTEIKKYFVVVKLAGVALPGETFKYIVEDLTLAGTNPQKSGLPSVTMEGLVIDTPQFVFTDTSPATVEKVFLTFTGICQVFTVGYPNGPDDKPGSINVNSNGTADESTDLVNTQLWWDSDNDSAFDDTLDTQIDTQVFTQDDGLVSFSLATLPDFQQGDTRRFFVVHLLNTNADDLETFQCYISDMGAAPLGGTPVGLPTPNANGTPGLEVSAAILFGIMNGPSAPLTVDSNSAGVTGDGELLADVTLEALPGGDWVINTMIFNAGGTANHNNAYTELALYEDINANGTWEGAAVDTLAAPITSGFVANVVSFDLTLTDLLAGTERRFFLTGKLSGTAASGETLNARLTDVLNSPPPGGSRNGFPTPASTALVIDVAVISVANGPNQPVPATHAAGAAANLVAAGFRLNALNGATTVNGIDLTTAGTGDWSSDVDSASGVQVYRDDGDGVFDITNDVLLAQSGGSALVTVTFTTPLNLAAGEIADLWVVIGMTATAGQGIAATPETFSLAIANTTDVGASAPVEFGMPAPNGITVGAIEFNVTNFDPASGLAAGGQALTISGSGFMPPFSVTIAGTPCLGTPVIAGGTQVTGLTVPTGFGIDLPIVVQSGDLPPQTLTQTFTYTAPKDAGGTSKDEGSSCSAGNSPAWALTLAVLGLLAAVALRRRTSA
jgi:MYXO-CTERM domain-containing protein